MKVALCSRAFRPEPGGLGSVTHSYALGMIELGWQPCVITATAAPAAYDTLLPYPVHRHPRFREFRRLLRANDVVVFIHQSLIYVAWSIGIGRPVVSTIHGQIWNFSTVRNAVTSLILEIHLRLRPHVALISNAVRSPATARAPVIGNPYDTSVFRADGSTSAPGTLLFSGRIARGKGIFTAIEAVQILLSRGREVSLTFAGSGADDETLRSAVEAAGLGQKVKLLGHCEPDRVSALLRQHQIAVIPSQWDEPFGLVALEAIASGAYVVAFPDGGLPEAIGKAGLVTTAKTPAALADAIDRVMESSHLAPRNRFLSRRTFGTIHSTRHHGPAG